MGTQKTAKLLNKKSSQSSCYLELWLALSLTLKIPRKPASENVACLCRLLNILANFSNSKTYFCIQANSVDPDQTAPREAVWSGSALCAIMTFKITSRWQSRRQLLWLAGLRVKALCKIVADDILIFLFFHLWEKIMYDISCQLSAYQTFHMKCQV